MNIVTAGNPGAGKSTLLNALLKKPEFRAGVSVGGGLTKILQVVKDELGNCYTDTPGLSDPKMRKQAAVEIGKALKSGGSFKVFFVITLESGRIRPDDKTTMQLVLEAAKDIGNNYSVIVNKCSEEVIQELEDDRPSFLALLNENLPGTESVFFNPEDERIRDKKNQVPVLSGELLRFIQEAPIVKIEAENVQAIKEDLYEKVRDEMAQKYDALMAKQKQMFEEEKKETQKKLENMRIESERRLQEEACKRHRELQEEKVRREQETAQLKKDSERSLDMLRKEQDNLNKKLIEAQQRAREAKEAEERKARDFIESEKKRKIAEEERATAEAKQIQAEKAERDAREYAAERERVRGQLPILDKLKADRLEYARYLRWHENAIKTSSTYKDAKSGRTYKHSEKIEGNKNMIAAIDKRINEIVADAKRLGLL